MICRTWVWKARPWSPGGGFFVVFMHGWVVVTPGVFLLEVGWEALVFGHFPQPSLFGATTFLLYSPSWLILALHLLVGQMFISVSIPSIVPSYFLLVTKIEVYTVQTSFLINRIWTLAGAFNTEGTHFPWSNFTPCFRVGLIPLISSSEGYLGIVFTSTLVFSLKFWNAEDRVVPQSFPLTPGHWIFVLGKRPPRHRPWAQIKFGPDCRLLGPTIAPQNPAIHLLGWIWGFWWHDPDIRGLPMLVNPCHLSVPEVLHPPKACS